jgi:hypothetical protein
MNEWEAKVERTRCKRCLMLMRRIVSTSGARVSQTEPNAS